MVMNETILDIDNDELQLLAIEVEELLPLTGPSSISVNSRPGGANQSAAGTPTEPRRMLLGTATAGQRSGGGGGHWVRRSCSWNSTIADVDQSLGFKRGVRGGGTQEVGAGGNTQGRVHTQVRFVSQAEIAPSVCRRENINVHLLNALDCLHCRRSQNPAPRP